MHYKGQERAISPYLQSGMKYGRGPPPGIQMGHLMRYDMEAPPQPPMSPKAPLPMPMPLPPPPPPAPANPDCEAKNLNKLFGMTASDIDKYSRIFFPVTFTCFQVSILSISVSAEQFSGFLSSNCLQNFIPKTTEKMHIRYNYG
jgi:hypothetical protein